MLQRVSLVLVLLVAAVAGRHLLQEKNVGSGCNDCARRGLKCQCSNSNGLLGGSCHCTVWGDEELCGDKTCNVDDKCCKLPLEGGLYNTTCVPTTEQCPVAVELPTPVVKPCGKKACGVEQQCCELPLADGHMQFECKPKDGLCPVAVQTLKDQIPDDGITGPLKMCGDVTCQANYRCCEILVDNGDLRFMCVENESDCPKGAPRVQAP